LLKEFFHEQQNVLNTSSENTTNNNSTSPTKPLTQQDKILPYHNVSFQTSTSNNNIIHKHKHNSNSPTSSQLIQGCGSLPPFLHQPPSFSADLNKSNQLDHQLRFLPSLNNKDFSNNQYRISSSVGFDTSGKPVQPSSLPYDLTNNTKSILSSFSSSSALQSGSEQVIIFGSI
jgi:hypothetical protein